ncbi:Translation initiation factor 2 subunit alpha [Acidilobus saccharovorans 345-15]|uniref:Translation initiation factor 2 subunit alpha n=1 Tax=Acidilobus saccharovorans (strain DSM 16705 / JCM 18335 / VKM B-2471 / 345-15) TaxID=666510 RepID=D9PZX2_ACIS3|nr:translation initiation factor IF-2 subunit alpha [Acidilobus saccharovorans]ADL18610.1 Translation initiation factor 2 subunit alpha [Acidilobus saccharovorans 345-15]
MPLLNRRQLPDVGEVVVGTVKELHDYGAYLELDEFNGLRAFLPWVEVSSRSFKSIDDVIKVNERVAVKVIRVNRAKGQVDVSLKKVTDDERRKKMTWWKRTQKAVNIILMIAKELKKAEKQAYAEVIWRLEDKYGDVMTALEMAATEGEQPLAAAGVPEEWLKPLAEAAKKYVEVKKVKVSLLATVKSLSPDGIEKIKAVLKSAEEAVASKGDSSVSVKIYAIGAPRYRIDLMGVDYKELEQLAQGLEEVMSRAAKELGVEFSLERLRE